MSDLGNIPVGFQLHVTTWENDADHYRTEIISGLSEDDVRFLVSIAQEFKSRNGSPKGLGNGSVDGEQLRELIREKLFDHPNISEDVRTTWQEGADDEGAAYSLISDMLLGTPQEEGYWDEGNFCRVFDGFQVFYFPEAVRDVTANFE